MEAAGKTEFAAPPTRVAGRLRCTYRPELGPGFLPSRSGDRSWRPIDRCYRDRMRWLDMLGGGAGVYVVVAACSSPSSAPAAHEPRDGGGGGAVHYDAAQDAIADPTPTAEAAPIEDATITTPMSMPDTATEPCNKISPQGYGYAEHLYPGKTRDELAAYVRTVGHLSKFQQTIDPTYEYALTLAQVADGKVAVICSASGGAIYDSVTFVLP